jgi:imidazole glycerol phosphate synthase subunit HisF
LFFTNIEKDGTGAGLDMDFTKYLERFPNKPLIMSGGVGNYKHIEVVFKK